MPDTRPIHYAGAGTGGDFFSCYHEELKAHVAACDALKAATAPHYPTRAQWRNVRPAAPRRHTSLSNVTCDYCWRQIATMARVRLNGG